MITKKRKQEILKALDRGRTVLYFRSVYGTYYYEKSRIVISVRGNIVTDIEGGKYLVSDDDELQILKGEA